jgi:hypothetical protein
VGVDRQGHEALEHIGRDGALRHEAVIVERIRGRRRELGVRDGVTDEAD